MPQLKSFDAATALKKSAQLQEGVDEIPSEISKTIWPVIDITPRKHRIANIVRDTGRSTTGTSTVYTTPTDQDFFLTSAFVSGTSDATADNTFFAILATIDGVSRNLLKIYKTTLTAASISIPISYIFPIKIDRGTNISITTSFSVGTSTVEGGITGYTVTNPQGN